MDPPFQLDECQTLPREARDGVRAKAYKLNVRGKK
jgi:hypothetical protein